MSDEEDIDERFIEVQEVVAQCAECLHGRDPEIQGAALADLVSMWVAGHFGPEGFREQLIEEHVDTVRRLLPINEKIILEQTKEDSH